MVHLVIVCSLARLVLIPILQSVLSNSLPFLRSVVLENAFARWVCVFNLRMQHVATCLLAVSTSFCLCGYRRICFWVDSVLASNGLRLCGMRLCSVCPLSLCKLMLSVLFSVLFFCALQVWGRFDSWFDTVCLSRALEFRLRR